MVIETAQRPLLETSSIRFLGDLVDRLPGNEGQIFADQYELRLRQVHLNFPDEMREFVQKQLGKSPEEASYQNLVHVQDRWTKESAVYNVLRSQRPKAVVSGEDPFRLAIEEGHGSCSFCAPERSTPVNGSGRKRRGVVVSSGNLTPFADYHELLIFNHDPFKINGATFCDIVELASGMAREQYDRDNSLRHFSLLMNFGFKAGGSLAHGHAQLLMNRGSMHFPRAERYNMADLMYRRECGRDFFADKFRVHEALGLGWQAPDAWVFAPLCPPKDRGVMVIERERQEFVSADFADSCFKVIDFMLRQEGVREFNMALFLTPFGRNNDSWWRDSRNFAMFVDRGTSRVRTADMGAAEVLAELIVVEQDPFRWGQELGKYLKDPRA